MREQKSQQGALPACDFDNKILRRCFDPYLNHFVEPRDIQRDPRARFFCGSLSQILKRFVSFAKFYFGLRGLPLSSI
jgi:hypothetical protein